VNFRLPMLVLMGLLLVVVMPLHSAMAEEEFKLQASAVWQSKGSVYLIGENEALFVGGFSGIMFANDKKGNLNAAQLVCPSMMEINLQNGETSGQGRCIITNAEGHRVFAKWQCEGAATQGCKGDFKFLAGTEKFQGVSGGGEFVLRSAIGKLTADLVSGDVNTIGLGLAAWPNLTVKLP